MADSRRRVELVTHGADHIARAILTSLPDWFGRPTALEAYVAAAGRLPTLVALSAEGQAVGFATLERHTDVAAEIHVMGVLQAHHGRRYGRALIEQAELDLTTSGIKWLTVETLAASHPDPHYADTRRFYGALGFEPLEVFPTLWDEDTPCLLMVKPLRLPTPATFAGHPRPISE